MIDYSQRGSSQSFPTYASYPSQQTASLSELLQGSVVGYSEEVVEDPKEGLATIQMEGRGKKEMNMMMEQLNAMKEMMHTQLAAINLSIQSLGNNQRIIIQSLQTLHQQQNEAVLGQHAPDLDGITRKISEIGCRLEQLTQAVPPPSNPPVEMDPEFTFK